MNIDVNGLGSQFKEDKIRRYILSGYQILEGILNGVMEITILDKSLETRNLLFLMKLVISIFDFLDPLHTGWMGINRAIWILISFRDFFHDSFQIWAKVASEVEGGLWLFQKWRNIRF